MEIRRLLNLLISTVGFLYWLDNILILNHAQLSALAVTCHDRRAATQLFKIHMATSSSGKFPRYWPFVGGIHRSPVNSPHKGQWHGASVFSVICAWTNGWVNNRGAGDLKRHRSHYDVTVISSDHFVTIWRSLKRVLLIPSNIKSLKYHYAISFHHQSWQTTSVALWITAAIKESYKNQC